MGARELPDRRRGSLQGEEELRFIRNFHDVFLSIGLAMFAGGLGVFSTLIIGDLSNIGEDEEWRRIATSISGVSFLDAAIMWALAEFFARGRRLFLPAIVILIAFAAFFSSGVFAGYVALFGEQAVSSLDEGMETLKLMPMTITGATTLAILAYYARMKLPFAMGLAAIGLAAFGVSAFAYRYPDALLENAWRLTLFSGLFLFVLGVFFDARDPERRTRLSDNGFWLHFFAAPLIFTSVTAMVTGQTGLGANSVQASAATLVIVLIFAVVSLLLNRRALLVAGLLSAAVSIGVLISNAGMDAAWTSALTLLLLGGTMVLLGGGWHTVRRFLVSPFPKKGLIARIIPPEPNRHELEQQESR